MNRQPSITKLRPPSKEAIGGSKFEFFHEFQAQILVVWFLAWATVIVHFLQFTLIPLLEASQLFVLIGMVGFFLVYAFRKRFHFGLLDGLYYNLFGVAPFVLGSMLWMNATCSDIYLEKHRTTHFERGGRGFVFELENEAYVEFWRIRNFETDLVPVRNPTITYTFCDGMLGYKVMKDVIFE